MSDTQQRRKVFVSYSWTNPLYRESIIEIATRLQKEYGVEVEIDAWKLQPGHDMHAFMEKLTSSSIHKVLIMCNAEYKRKAEESEGGTKEESSIIRADMYKNIKGIDFQTKYIPVYMEEDSSGGLVYPSYLTGRYGVDLSTPEKYDRNFMRLVRTIYDQPEIDEPELGSVPNFCSKSFDVDRLEKPLQRVKSQIGIGQFSSAIVTDFFHELFQVVKRFVNSKDADSDDLINDLIIVSDEVAVFLKECVVMNEYIEEVCNQQMYLFIQQVLNIQKSHKYNEEQVDRALFVLRESVFSLSVVLLHYRKYKLFNQLHQRLTNEIQYRIMSYLPELYRGIITRRLDFFHDAMRLPKGFIVSTDLLLHCLSFLNANQDSSGWIPFFAKDYSWHSSLSDMPSFSHDESCLILGVTNIDESKDELLSTTNRYACGYRELRIHSHFWNNYLNHTFMSVD